MSDLPLWVVLPTSYTIKAFRQVASKMSIVDYDLDELLVQAVDLHHYPSDRMGYHLEELAKRHMQHGSFDKQTTDDGVILAQAFVMLTMGINGQLEDHGLYSDTTTLQYRLERTLGDDLVLVRLPHPT